MNFIDDYTNMCSVYLLKHKSQAFYFHVWIENEEQSHIDTFHTNNGGEYTLNKFESYLCQHGIKQQSTIPYNPQHNVVAKRMEMTLLNMVLFAWEIIPCQQGEKTLDLWSQNRLTLISYGDIRLDYGSVTVHKSLFFECDIFLSSQMHS